ncbi:MAG: ABC-F family ATP-binding cassette domain-containing protein [Roseivirga sp.]|jgi:ATP-binding cassette subfamily F protein uup|uniref:ABC-F family ATP-binding cassette domain-containing protein n=1 Tax=Roseivirga sp. TaxID=1964215 RepID=UPI001B15F043|nr:ABC-F family ATP-binding cassette domain-containing protein [Roseivirga sp.]MBO6495306.1 ABC-F family ATP-binding cassette domain-containing protein [Roseivirga sp.]
MNYLSVENLSKTFGDRTILNQVTFGVAQGEKVALVGVNGSGKSTLLKILTGIETPDSGQVVFKNGITVKHLLQNPEFSKGQSVLDAVFDDNNPDHLILKQYEKALLKSLTGEENHDEIQQLIEQIDSKNLWDLESQAKQILGKLDIHDLQQEVQLLSGGQQKRISLASVLIQKPDLLILDEPTNHLDIDTIEWLEKYLSVANMALILVTHDRYFLEQVTNNILELELGKAYSYQGNYAYFLEKKAEREINEAASIDKAKNIYRKELDWIRRQPKARGTKAKYRVDAFQETKDKAFSAQKTNELELNAQASRQGKKVLEIAHLSHGFGEKSLIKDFSYTFQRKDRIGIVGPNGSGKTTFIRLLMGELTPNAGEIEQGQTTKFGYYRQVEESFNPEQTIIDFAKSIAEVVEVGKGRTIPVSQFLTRFLFAPDVQYKPIGKLSGGEKRRLQLLEILIQSPNFLVLDEPTNDLDLITLGTLENYLEGFDGSLIIVSHDRYFMDKLVDHLFVFDGSENIKDFPGNYTDFRNSIQDTPAPSPKASESKKDKQKEPKERKKLSFKEQREFEQLEAEIPKLEVEKAKLIEQMNTETDHEKLMDISGKVEAITEQLDEKELRWLELSEIS